MTTLPATQTKQSHRIASIDILRGIVMVIMALDHTREFFHQDALAGNDPMDFKTTWPFLFFTRWITHYCAPVFVFLSGLSVFLYAQKGYTKKQVASFLFTRGLWLVFAEIFIINGLWQFSYSHFLLLQVFWAIGISMIFLSVIQLLPYRIVLSISLLIVFCHNLLDGIQITQPKAAVFIWSLIHSLNLFQPSPDFVVLVGYPFLPWLGLMICGYCLGKIYTANTDKSYRKKFLLITGVSMICLFIALRFLKMYGDRNEWETQSTALNTVLDFVNTTKYPPSLQYMLMTIGPALIALSFLENIANTFTRIMTVYGKVPFVYYILHIFLLHSLARFIVLFSGRGSGDVIFPGIAVVSGSGYPLWTVYLIWIVVVVILYFPCRWYGRYRASHPEKKWLTYL